MKTKGGAEIQQVGKEWFVVVAQRSGGPLRFLCETKRDAERFLGVFQRPTRKVRYGSAASTSREAPSR